MLFASYLLFFFGAAFFSMRRIVQYLRFLQQEEYTLDRFFDWIQEYSFFDTKGSAVAIFGLIISYFFSDSPKVLFFIAAFVSLALMFVVAKEKDPTKEGKITLKMTARATRIGRVAAVFSLFTLTFFTACFYFIETSIGLKYSFTLYCFWLILYFQVTPIFLAFAVKTLSSGEKKIQDAFLNEAKQKFKEYDPYTVGITGSYGKTSTKALLGRILDASLGPTFWPQKGINTPMGITREIREKLNANQKHAVVEMGAYRPGSIKRLCELTPPKAGIITAVGIMHLERMGGVEGVLNAKSELAQAIPDDGILICNADNEGAKEIARRHPKQTTLFYSLKSGEADSLLSINSVDVSGTHFEVIWKSNSYKGFTKLHGEPALSNMLASFTMACALGAPPENVLASIRNIEAVSNRLEVVAVAGGVQINDAYNSNPVGFAAALRVLDQLEGERKILVSPGMIDIGDLQAQENQKVASLAAEICDIVYVVGDVNKEALLKGLSEKSFPQQKIKLFSNRNDALLDLANDRRPADVVLIENDLPDLFELDISL